MRLTALVFTQFNWAPQLKGLEVIFNSIGFVPRGLRAVVTGLVLAGSGSAVFAETLTYADQGFANQGITLKFATNAARTTFYSPSVTAGSLTGTLSPSGSQFTMYCIDPLTWAAQGSVVVTPAPSLGSYLGGGSPNYTTQFAQTAYTNVAVGGYDDQAAATVNTRLTDLYKYAYADSLTSAVKGAAFQYAIWEALGETSANLGRSVGGLQMTTGVAGLDAQVDTYLTALTSGNWGSLTAINDYLFTVYVPNPQSGSQAFMSVTRSGQTGGNVPEPTSMALALVGLFAATRRINQRRH